MDTRDLYKLVRELSEEHEGDINLYDSVDIELTENFVIETGVVGFMEDGIVVQLDEDAMEMLDFNGVLLESENLNENPLLMTLGRAAAMGAGSELASRAADKIGLEESYDDIDTFKTKVADSDDAFEMIYDAIKGDYGEEVRTAIQEMYDDVVIDSQGRLHPDDDFEQIIERVVDQISEGYYDSDIGLEDELGDIKRLAHGDEEVTEGLGKALLGGAALIAAITGVNKYQADQLMKSEPQLVKLAQMRQQAEQQGDTYKVKELDDRIEKTLDHITVTGRPVMGTDGNPVVPGEPLGEAEYQGRTVPLNKPMKGDVKKSKVYVKKPDGKVVKVNFGDKNMRIKKSNPERRKSFRARHKCENPGPKWKARYWSCRAW